MTDEEMKQWIDDATLEQLLNKWRFAPVGEPMFQGDIGKYYAKVMTAKRSADPAGWVAASKRIGWD